MIARKSALIIAIQLANGILGYIGLKFIALYMEPWEYGIVGFAYGFVALFSIFGKLGFDSAHIKRVSEGRDLSHCTATFAVTKMFLAGLMAAIVIGSLGVWKYVIGRGFESPLHEQAVYVMLAYFVLFTLAQSIITTFRARKEIAKSQLPFFAYNFVRIITTIFVAFYGFGVLALAYTYLLGEICHFILALLFFRGYPVGRPSLSLFKEYVSFAAPMAIATASWIIMTNIDKVFIQLFWGAEQVGQYFAVFNLTRFIILFATSVSMLLLPTFSEHHAKNNVGEIKRIVVLSERYLSMVVFPIIITMMALAQPIITILLSGKYIPALPVLQILPLFVLMEVLSRPYDSQIQGMNMPTIARNRVLIMMVINVVLNMLLIPRDIKSLGLSLAGLGAEGAAIATVVSYVAGLLYLRIQAWRLTGITGSPRVLFHVPAAVLAGCVVWYLHSFIGRWYELLFAGMLSFGIYFVLLFLMKEFRKEDFDLFFDTVNPKKMLAYIKEELRGNR